MVTGTIRHFRSRSPRGFIRGVVGWEWDGPSPCRVRGSLQFACVYFRFRADKGSAGVYCCCFIYFCTWKAVGREECSSLPARGLTYAPWSHGQPGAFGRRLGIRVARVCQPSPSEALRKRASSPNRRDLELLTQVEERDSIRCMFSCWCQGLVRLSTVATLPIANCSPDHSRREPRTINPDHSRIGIPCKSISFRAPDSFKGAGNSRCHGLPQQARFEPRSQIGGTQGRSSEDSSRIANFPRSLRAG